MAAPRLQTRLTRLYAALFAAVLVLVSAAVVLAVAANGQTLSQAALASTGRVFDRLWDTRVERLHTGAAVLSRDFGFREALATRDAATISSSVENLSRRLKLDLAFVLSPQGELLTSTSAQAVVVRDHILSRLQDGDAADGVLVVGGVPYEIVAAPILSPDLAGWLVFAQRLDGPQLKAIEALSALPLRASIAYRDKGGSWRSAGGAMAADAAGIPSGRQGMVVTHIGDDYVLTNPLPALAGGQDVDLLLAYPASAAMAPFRWLLVTIVGLGLFGLALVVVGGWLIARGVTGPLAALTQAAERLQAGEDARVEIASDDEVGRLGSSFNAMADAVADRERRIQQAAVTDADTGLPNRLALEQAEAQASADAAGQVYAAAFGIDRYAQMRAVMGYGLAAALLKALGADLSANRPGWRVARVSGDALGAVFTAPDPETAAQWVEAERRRMEGARRLDAHSFDVKLAAGLAAGASDETELSLIRRADIALDRARAGATHLTVFEPASYAGALAELSLMPELRQAIAADALSLAHQPKYDLRAQTICGVESLVRWTHPVHGPISPARFVPLAEETGDIRALSDWVFARAIADQAELAAAGRPLPFSVNLSGRLVGDEAFIDRVLDLAKGASAPLCAEITETAIIADADAALAGIARLSEAGVAISIDDFGSGLSSLGYLKRLPAHELKLDRSLIVDLASSSRDALLVRSTIDLAHGLGMKVTGEGVEDGTVASLLAGLGCDQLQGWHIAKPMPLAALRQFLEASETEAQAQWA